MTSIKCLRGARHHYCPAWMLHILTYKPTFKFAYKQMYIYVYFSMLSMCLKNFYNLPFKILTSSWLTCFHKKKLLCLLSDFKRIKKIYLKNKKKVKHFHKKSHKYIRCLIRQYPKATELIKFCFYLVLTILSQYIFFIHCDWEQCNWAFINEHANKENT